MNEFNCRICFEDGENLISPCNCSSLVHSSCLHQWLRTNTMDDNTWGTCEVCMEPYKIKTVYKVLNRLRFVNVIIIYALYILIMLLTTIIGTFLAGDQKTGVVNNNTMSNYDLDPFNYIVISSIIMFSIVYLLEIYVIMWSSTDSKLQVLCSVTLLHVCQYLISRIDLIYFIWFIVALYDVGLWYCVKKCLKYPLYYNIE